MAIPLALIPTIWEGVKTFIGGPIKGYTERKKIKIETEMGILKARSQATIKSVERGEIHEQDVEKLLISQSGWKDEYWTIIISIPLILCFFDGYAPQVKAGFAALDETPMWFQTMCVIVIGSPFGVRLKNFITHMMQWKTNKQ